MNIHKFVLTVLDFDQLGAKEITLSLENLRHLSINVLSVETRDIGEWDDKSPLNFTNTHKEEAARIFSESNKV